MTWALRTIDPAVIRKVVGLARHVWPVDLLHGAFFLLMVVMTSLVGPQLPHHLEWLVGDLLVLGAIGFVAVRSGGDAVRDGFVRLFLGAVLIPVAFTQVGLVLVAMDPRDRAPDLAAVDRWIFGDPSWLERSESWATPLVVELLQWAFTAYLPLPVVAMAVLLFGAEPALRRRATTVLAAVFYLSYIGYILVPASGPNIHNNFGPVFPSHVSPRPLFRFDDDLPGLLWAEELRALMFRIEAAKFDCFPSGHTAIAVVSAGIVHRIHRGWAIPFHIVAAGITVATIMLRYHYVIDVVIGLLLAAGGILCLGRRSEGRAAGVQAR